MAIKNADKKILDSIIDQEKKTIVLNFWAPWCGPCRMFHPQLVKLDELTSDKIQVVKVNIDENPELASDFGIMSIPNTKVIVNKNIIESFSGFLPYNRLVEELEAYL